MNGAQPIETYACNLLPIMSGVSGTNEKPLTRLDFVDCGTGRTAFVIRGTFDELREVSSAFSDLVNKAEERHRKMAK